MSLTSESTAWWRCGKNHHGKSFQLCNALPVQDVRQRQSVAMGGYVSTCGAVEGRTCATRPTLAWWPSYSAVGWKLQATTPTCRCYSAKHVRAMLSHRNAIWVKSLDHIHTCVLGCALRIRKYCAWLCSVAVAVTWGELNRH
jgi:hypothetical protein